MKNIKSLDKKIKYNLYNIYPAITLILPIIFIFIFRFNIAQLKGLVFSLSILGFIIVIFSITMYLKNKKIFMLRTLFCFGLGLLVTPFFSSSYSFEGNKIFDDVTHIQGVACSDSKISGRNTIIKVRTKNISNKNIVSSCEREVTFICKGKKECYIGQEIEGKVLFLKDEKSSLSRAKNYAFFVSDLRIGEFTKKFYKFRFLALKKLVFINRQIGKESSAFFEALFIGNKNNLDSPLLKVFVDSGCSHLIALSGMHLGIIVVFITIIFSPIFSRKKRTAITIFILLLYLFFTGSGVSLKRAFLMYSIFGVLSILGMKINSLNIVSISFFLLAIIYPEDVSTLSFILSYAAVYGIIYLSPKISYTLSYYLPKEIVSPLAISYSAQLFVMPFLLYYIGEINLLGIFASIFASPFLLFFLFFRLLGIFLYTIYLRKLAIIFGFFSDISFSIIKNILIFFSNFPKSNISNGALIFVLPFILLIFLEYIIVYKRRKQINEV